MLNHLASNPWRPPDWRWHRALGIIDGMPRSTPQRDGDKDSCKWINRATRFKRAIDGAATDRAKLTVALRYPDIYWAHWIRILDEDTHHQTIRYSIEARLLARESSNNIGYRHGCDPLVVEAYEALFFNVRDRLHNRDFIVAGVLGEAVHRGLTERQYDLLWKLMGYCCGPHLLDALIGKLVNPGWANRPEDVPQVLQDAAINLMKMKATVASLLVPVNSNTYLALIESFVKYVEIERTTDSAGKAADQILTNIDAMLQSIPFAVGTNVASGATLSYDHTHVELRQDELLLAGAGADLPHRRMLESMQFPAISPMEIEVVKEDPA
jgi:hypothetical protein